MAFGKFTRDPVTGQPTVMPLPRPANLAQMRATQAKLSSAKPPATGNLPSDALPKVKADTTRYTARQTFLTNNIP